MKWCLYGLAVAQLAFASAGTAQTDQKTYPIPEDVATLDGIIKAYYDVVSGPAGETADRRRDESLHHPAALVAITGVDADNTPVIRTMTLGEYHDRSGPRARGFYEWEIHRVTETFGSVTHVWSTYAASETPDGPVNARGINSIQLYFDGTRWWITSWIFDSERDDNPIPARYLSR
jgi:hypothetical protein